MSRDDPPDYDEQELAQARSLAAALDPSQRVQDDVRDALDAAELIRATRRGGLSDARSTLTFQRVEQRVQASRRRRIRRWIASGGVLTAAAGVVLVFAIPAARELAPAATKSVPEVAATSGSVDRFEQVSAAVRAAQRAWLDDPTPATHATLEKHLRRLRNAQLEALQSRYGR